MTPCMGESTTSLRLPYLHNESLQKTLEKNEDKFLEFATQQSLHLNSNTRVSTYAHNAQETLTLPTKCYEVDFNGEFATITLLK